MLKKLSFVEIDRKTGDYRTFRQWTVVADEDHEMPACQDAISDVDPAKWSIGDVRELEVESIEFGRIAAQIAKQVIVQKIREAERALVADAYESKVGELIYGEVKTNQRWLHYRLRRQRRSLSCTRRDDSKRNSSSKTT